MNIIVLGSGPAGLFAAHAAAGLGASVRILSMGRKSEIHGAQFLRKPVPGLSGDSFFLSYHLVGSLEGYSRKVMGETDDLNGALETLTDDIEAWDFREAYDRAWEEYAPLVREYTWENGLDYESWNWADLVVSTIPAWDLCDSADHRFHARYVWTMDYVKRFDQFESESVDNLVVCSGLEDDWWYRRSRIRGVESTEFGGPDIPASVAAKRSTLPTWTDCDCRPDYMRVGRLGKWDPAVFADSAFYDVQDRILEWRSTR